MITTHYVSTCPSIFSAFSPLTRSFPTDRRSGHGRSCWSNAKGPSARRRLSTGADATVQPQYTRGCVPRTLQTVNCCLCLCRCLCLCLAGVLSFLCLCVSLCFMRSLRFSLFPCFCSLFFFVASFSSLSLCASHCFFALSVLFSVFSFSLHRDAGPHRHERNKEHHHSAAIAAPVAPAAPAVNRVSVNVISDEEIAQRKNSELRRLASESKIR